MEEQLRKELIMAAARVLGDNAANRLEMVGKPDCYDTCYKKCKR